MSLAKQSVKSDYIATPESRPKTHDVARKAYKRAVTEHSSMYTLWLLVVKHRIGILVTGNVILVLNWAIPMWPNIVKSVLESIVR